MFGFEFVKIETCRNRGRETAMTVHGFKCVCWIEGESLNLVIDDNYECRLSLRQTFDEVGKNLNYKVLLLFLFTSVITTEIV